ncbi:hypothetical protein ASF00_09200 [Sphingomonas sp. Leaf34]|uniref:hypothetical protein n=1 Tax=Sphingomonas sp. Leaf34 TaxID=1736216 RepID=UPI0006FFD5DC|nr:hypothetical protein [Sphingomonas sp. Leaf34]KQN28074.1 hypothetical protein ASF00_09200 [Sphingomonas sp. Leaf34]
MKDYSSLLEIAKSSLGKSYDTLMATMVEGLERKISDSAAVVSSFEDDISDTYAEEARKLGVDEEDGLSDSLLASTGISSAGKALDALYDNKVANAVKVQALADAIGARILWRL